MIIGDTKCRYHQYVVLRITKWSVSIRMHACGSILINSWGAYKAPRWKLNTECFITWSDWTMCDVTWHAIETMSYWYSDTYLHSIKSNQWNNFPQFSLHLLNQSLLLQSMIKHPSTLRGAQKLLSKSEKIYIKNNTPWSWVYARRCDTLFYSNTLRYPISIMLYISNPFTFPF